MEKKRIFFLAWEFLGSTFCLPGVQPTPHAVEAWSPNTWNNFQVQHTAVLTWTVGSSNQSILKEISPEYYWKDWCWSWNSNTLGTWCEELTHLKGLWCWERLKVGWEGDDRGWDGWMASPTRWTWVWESSGSQWWTGKPGMLQSMGLQIVRHNWVTELNWTEVLTMVISPLSFSWVYGH